MEGADQDRGQSGADNDGTPRARFQVGQPIHHRLFGYRGVIVDVDPIFCLSEEWYDYMARSKPPKDKPWYHILKHNSDHMTYVAEQNLEPDLTGAAVSHPQLDQFFSDFKQGLYQRRQAVN